MKIDLKAILTKELFDWIEEHPKRNQLIESIQGEIFQSIVHFREWNDSDYNGNEDWLEYAIRNEEEWRNETD
ncbi:hypothetical protein [Guptibacillus hwajinpoensis]|uniref:Uncharacterized protein n=1 Tax=Guptibacillus hwajinpoensis TaxID=208199 RepID=A0ABU0K4B8_9BACL|nr:MULTISPECIES: hypothetical protein [Alkalihalobacillus]MDP4550709.1 hypothetical protein [Alkalihalobacillus macyae]MDQ0483505.1 hypothetical protein [Alkalihalobacillus hemicentroti]